MNGELKALNILKSIRAIAWDVAQAIGITEDALCEAIDSLENTLKRPTPAPGALPELPEAVAFCEGDNPCNRDAFAWPGIDRHARFDSPLYTADQMHAYARAYAEQCRAGVVVTDAQCEAIYQAVSMANLTRDVKSPERKREVVRAALQSAFADDEGVKRG